MRVGGRQWQERENGERGSEHERETVAGEGERGEGE